MQQSRIREGVGCRIPLPIEMAPLGIMPTSEIRFRPSSLEWCRPRWRAQKRSTEFFIEGGPKKGQQKSPSTPVVAFRHRQHFEHFTGDIIPGPCRPRGPGIMSPSHRRPPAYENPGSAPGMQVVAGTPKGYEGRASSGTTKSQTYPLRLSHPASTPPALPFLLQLKFCHRENSGRFCQFAL